LKESDHSRVEHNSGHVIFLGTGDALNWERAQTSLALPLAKDEAMLIDASSGTVLLRQLEAAEIPLESVRHLFVSHLHFDHVGGLAPLLVAMAPLPGASLAVHATPRTLKGLKELLALTIPGVENWLEGRLIWREFAPGESVRLNDAEITPFRVDHGPECVGFRVTHAGSDAVFTADTRPCPEVVENAKGADLLIHEVYSLKYEAEQAHTLGHPTAAEAGRAAREAGAGRLVLTHFRASRFVDPKALAAEAEISFGHPVEVAGDLMASEF
jgi:ribonuclease BN (tRNA processing enzyme)